jgi:ribosomal protein S18 acetylase RimI-like enzyme
MSSDAVKHFDSRHRQIGLRSAVAEDQSFLFELYCSTRAEEVALWGWDAAQQEAFLGMQFKAQRQGYATEYPDAEHRIILVDGREAGRILVSRSELEILLVDLSLLPVHRGFGIGTRLIRDLLSEGVTTGRPVRLQVAASNPQAIRLYERLGFLKVADYGVYFQMECTP